MMGANRVITHHGGQTMRTDLVKKRLIVLNDQAASYGECFLEECILRDLNTVHFKGKINNDSEFYRYRFHATLLFYYSKSEFYLCNNLMDTL